ncbi:pre-peptidase C-terminal domain-containing protein [Scytonema sp. PCC 10023]|uniref:pre-peptidase C-terminal domain-containing protein n=1 Tax=Scytonema sp. PCC 10023 TaxID=1680591 RepID=UPI0039C7617A
MSDYDVGVLPSNGNPVIRNDLTLTPGEPTDVFEVRINSTRNINVALTGISAGDDADLRLYQDSNGNGRFDANSDQLVASSTRGGNNDDSINLADRAAGTYFAQVSRYSTSNGNVTYDLALSTANPSNLLPREFNLGNLSGDVTRTGRIDNNNTSDVYAFSLGSFEGVNITPSGLSPDLGIRLIHDRNGDRNVDSGDQTVQSVTGGTNSEPLYRIDDAGSYYLQVYQLGNGSTNYNLTFDHFTTPYA